LPAFFSSRIFGHLLPDPVQFPILQHMQDLFNAFRSRRAKASASEQKAPASAENAPADDSAATAAPAAEPAEEVESK
jgi:hypothetical protein